MPEDAPQTQSLAGRRVLVVEDEYFIADDLRVELGRCGAEVVGPVGRLAEVVTLMDTDHHLDLAVLDIDLHGEAAYGVAEILIARGVPFVFATGFGADAIPDGYAHVPRWEKPYRYGDLLRALPALLPTTPGTTREGSVRPRGIRKGGSRGSTRRQRADVPAGLVPSSR